MLLLQVMNQPTNPWKRLSFSNVNIFCGVKVQRCWQQITKSIYTVPCIMIVGTLTLILLFAIAHDTCQINYKCCESTLIKPWCTLRMVKGNIKTYYHVKENGKIYRDARGHYVRKNVPPGACVSPFVYYDEICVYTPKDTVSIQEAADRCKRWQSFPCPKETIIKLGILEELDMTLDSLNDPEDIKKHMRNANKTRLTETSVSKKQFICCLRHYTGSGLRPYKR